MCWIACNKTPYIILPRLKRREAAKYTLHLKQWIPYKNQFCQNIGIKYGHSNEDKKNQIGLCKKKSSPSLKRLKDTHNDIGTISFYSINILTLGTLHLEDNKVQKPK